MRQFAGVLERSFLLTLKAGGHYDCLQTILKAHGVLQREAVTSPFHESTWPVNIGVCASRLQERSDPLHFYV
jgi:hypothetical protein